MQSVGLAVTVCMSLYTCAMLLQSQRQLQLSLEAHGRYITSLIEREGLQHRLLPQLIAAAGPSLARSVPGLAALTAQRQPSASAPLLGLTQSPGQLQASDAQHPQMGLHSLSGTAPGATGQTGQPSDQQTHFMPLSGSGATDFASHGLLGTGLLHLGPGHVQIGHSSAADASHHGPSSEFSPTPLSRPVQPIGANPFAAITQNGFGSDEGSPGLLLNTDLQAAAAAWDERQQCILPGPINPLVNMPAALPASSPYSMPLAGIPTALQHDGGVTIKKDPTGAS